jgi:hypothetical protein
MARQWRETPPATNRHWTRTNKTEVGRRRREGSQLLDPATGGQSVTCKKSQAMQGREIGACRYQHDDRRDLRQAEDRTGIMMRKSSANRHALLRHGTLAVFGSGKLAIWRPRARREPRAVWVAPPARIARTIVGCVACAVTNCQISSEMSASRQKNRSSADAIRLCQPSPTGLVRDGTWRTTTGVAERAGRDIIIYMHRQLIYLLLLRRGIACRLI